jgi:hypothetical protein
LLDRLLRLLIALLALTVRRLLLRRIAALLALLSRAAAGAARADA